MEIYTIETAVETAVTTEMAATPETAAMTMAEMTSAFGLLYYYVAIFVDHVHLLVSYTTVGESLDSVGGGGHKHGANV